jgi:hypothetical protein
MNIRLSYNIKGLCSPSGEITDEEKRDTLNENI